MKNYNYFMKNCIFQHQIIMYVLAAFHRAATKNA